MKRLVAVNAGGLRIGEDHPRARLTNAEVERIRSLHGEGVGYNTLAEKFEVAVCTIGRICRYERRAQAADRFKVVEVWE